LQATQNEYPESNKKGFGRLSSIFGFPLDLGFNIDLNPALYLDKNKSPPSSYIAKKSEGAKQSSLLPSSWLARPSKQPVPEGSVYEPPEYIPRKPTQPYIPLNPDHSANVVPSSSSDVHKRVKPDTRVKSNVKFPSTGVPNSPPPPQSWHPAYPNAETGFIPIEPFFHHTGNSNTNTKDKEPGSSPTAPSSTISSFPNTVGRTNAPTRHNTEKPPFNNQISKSTTLRPYGKDMFSEKPYETDKGPVEYNILPPNEDSYASSYSGSGEYEEYDASYRPVAIQSGGESDGRAQNSNKPQKSDLNLSNFWGLFGNERKNNNTTVDDSLTKVPLNFSNPIDASSIFPHERGTVPTGVQYQDGFAPSGPSGFSRRPTGKPTITKITMEERPNGGITGSGPTSASISAYDDDGIEMDNSPHPPIPPVLIGQPSEPFDWYYANYNNTIENPPLDVMDRLIERSKSFSGTIEEELRSVRNGVQCLQCKLNRHYGVEKFVLFFVCAVTRFLFV